MARSLNKVQLIGNLTRDPELRYTPQGTAVATIGLATNRSWKADSGDTKEDVEFHRIVAWDKLAEICSQLLKKGRKVYVEGSLQTRKWTGKDEVERQTTEIVINEMILLDSSGSGGSSYGDSQGDIEIPGDSNEEQGASAKNADTKKAKKEPKEETQDEDDDIPF